MKILIYTQRIGKTTINFIHNEIKYLDERHEVLVLSHFISEENPVELKNLQYIRHYENRKLGQLLRAANRIGIPFPSFEKDLNKVVKQFQPEVIHLHFGNIADRVLDYFHRTDIPIFISFHGHDASTKLVDVNYRKRLNFLFAQPHIHPIFVSEFMFANVKRAGVRIREKNILYYGTDISRFNRKKNDHPKTPFIFLQISSFVEKKGHVDTLKAYRLFLNQHPKLETQLVLGGGGTGMEAIQNLSKELGLENNIIFKDWVSADEAKDLMETAHAFLHHSVVAKNGDMEGIPNAIMEAMAMELPVLATIHSGIPELVEDGVNGFLVAEHDVESYAKRMHDLLEWSYLKKNRAKIINKFEKEKHGENLVSIYNLRR